MGMGDERLSQWPDNCREGIKKMAYLLDLYYISAAGLPSPAQFPIPSEPVNL